MSPSPVLPISLYLTDKAVLLVGDGAIADDRRSRLQAAGAEIRSVSPAAYQADMCGHVFLVLAHTGDAALDRQIVTDAHSRGRLAYAHDQPAISDFAMPAVARRGALSIAIATDGVAPALARRLREELDRLLLAAGPRLDGLVATLGRRRGELASADRAGELYGLACQLHIEGDITVDD